MQSDNITHQPMCQTIDCLPIFLPNSKGMATELADVVDYGHMLKDRLLTLLRVLCNSTNDTFCVYYKGRQ